MRSPTFCRAGEQRLTPLPTVFPCGTFIFLVLKSSRSFQQELASLSSSLVLRLDPWGEPSLLSVVRVPGTSASSSGLRVTPEGHQPLVVAVDAVFAWLPWGRWGAHIQVLNPCLVRLLGGPTGGGPTLTASGEPRVPMLRQTPKTHEFQPPNPPFCLPMDPISMGEGSLHHQKSMEEGG